MRKEEVLANMLRALDESIESLDSGIIYHIKVGSRLKRRPLEVNVRCPLTEACVSCASCFGWSPTVPVATKKQINLGGGRTPLSFASLTGHVKLLSILC